jgi:hypothetical protein
MNILAAREYQTPRNGPLTLEQTETRRLAYANKTTASPSTDFDIAAREMANGRWQIAGIQRTKGKKGISYGQV